ncbi:MAG: PhoH family protein [Deltaproteobacteria bacterium]|nr:PhoH family protein [Deltaproteobacteria bacterium]
MNDKNKIKCEIIKREFNLGSGLSAVAGVNDENLKVLAEKTKTTIKRRGDFLLIEGLDSDVFLVEECLIQFSSISKQGVPIYPDDVIRSVDYLCSNSSASLNDLFGERIEVQGQKRFVYARTLNQSRFIQAIRSKRLVFGVGPAGTGKSYLSIAIGVARLLRREVRKIILCRPAVEAGEKLGFLPGTLEEKVDPYMRPLFDALFDLLDSERVEEFLHKGIIEIAPLAFMRGRTLSNSFVILDEAQNTTIAQMKMFLTRLGFGSTFVINGDPTQIDLPKNEYSGLLDALERLSDINDLSIIFFDKQDVLRDPLVAKILSAYEEK